MKDVQQKTCKVDEEQVFTMALKRSQFLIKNFTNDIIHVTLGNNDTFSIIGAGSWERVFNNNDNRDGYLLGLENTNIVKVTAKAEGIVEVASIDW